MYNRYKRNFCVPFPDDSATNFALGKFPAQSSTVTGYPVYKSVDGKAYTCSMTEEFASIKYPQYWRVDMGGQVYVTGVTIVTMADKLGKLISTETLFRTVLSVLHCVMNYLWVGFYEFRTI